MPQVLDCWLIEGTAFASVQLVVFLIFSSLDGRSIVSTNLFDQVGLMQFTKVIQNHLHFVLACDLQVSILCM